MDTKTPVDADAVHQVVSEPRDASNLKIVDERKLDVAAAFLNRFQGDDAEYTATEEKALRWRLDKRLIPILWFNITLGAVDKSTISTAALYVSLSKLCCLID